MKKVSLFKKNILYYIDMGEDQNNSEEDRFEESLRQILDSAPSESRVSADKPPRRRVRPEVEIEAWETARRAEEAGSKTLFWFKLFRILAILAFVFFLTFFVHRITAVQ